MLRISEYIRDTIAEKPIRPGNGKSILIWNLTNLCNLFCEHCYASATQTRNGEISTEDAMGLIPELREAGVGFAILSGGEPLTRTGLFQISTALKEAGIVTYLSTNGLLVTEQNVELIRDHFDYVGISIDGAPEVHDRFRGKQGAHRRSLDAIRICLKEGIKVGVRFTLTPHTAESLPYIFELAETEGIPKVYISHLVYSGRANALGPLETAVEREATEMILEKAFQYYEEGMSIDIVTGNNEADSVLLLQEFGRRYPDKGAALRARLRRWGGNQAGARMLNINYKGEVRPDPFFQRSVGNVLEKPFTEIWRDDPFLGRLREQPRQLNGACKTCEYIDICNGNSRARSFAVHEDFFHEDPGCYFT
jgi:radical SAM protein with 4Fe4S-binding SPASM domain